MEIYERMVELGGFPAFLNGYNGIVCTDCNTVFYGPKGSKIIELRGSAERTCPICGGHQLLWIEKYTQPEGERDVAENKVEE